MGNGNGDNCTQILCVSQSYPDDGSLTIAVNPSGAGGIALNDNFETLQFRQPRCYGDPPPSLEIVPHAWPKTSSSGDPW